MQRRQSLIPASFSLGAGFVHALAAGTHVEHRQAALAMGLLALLQVSAGVAMLAKDQLTIRFAVATVNVAAIVGWIMTRTSGISFIDGFEASEKVQTADMLCAILGGLAVLTLVNVKLLSRIATPAFASIAAIALAAPASVTALRHLHSHTEATTPGWPRAYFPGEIDISGVAGVTPEQEARATKLIEDTQVDLAHWADYKVAESEGWISIGDEETGYEHFVNYGTLNDGHFLDPTRPESIVYKVYGDTRILVSAMFMAEGQPAIDDPQLTDFAGALLQWHVHNNLCWSLEQGERVIAGVTDAQGNCPPGSMLGAVYIPMIHVWVVPHPCGPFAAVEGLAEGQAAVAASQRVDVCGNHTH